MSVFLVQTWVAPNPPERVGEYSTAGEVAEVLRQAGVDGGVHWLLCHTVTGPNTRGDMEAERWLSQHEMDRTSSVDGIPDIERDRLIPVPESVVARIDAFMARRPGEFEDRAAFVKAAVKEFMASHGLLPPS